MKPTQEQVIAWAYISGIDIYTWMGVSDLALLTFAALAYEAGRKDENEACAKVCEELGEYWSAYKDTALLNGNVELSIAASGEPRAAASIAAAIRARREQ